MTIPLGTHTRLQFVHFIYTTYVYLGWMGFCYTAAQQPRTHFVFNRQPTAELDIYYLLYSKAGWSLEAAIRLVKNLKADWSKT